MHRDGDSCSSVRKRVDVIHVNPSSLITIYFSNGSRATGPSWSCIKSPVISPNRPHDHEHLKDVPNQDRANNATPVNAISAQRILLPPDMAARSSGEYLNAKCHYSLNAIFNIAKHTPCTVCSQKSTHRVQQMPTFTSLCHFTKSTCIKTQQQGHFNK
ncbi:hypothetical protein K432DRAFT_376771 [Lepidopterella palustris CBS 459.81]|uniref:Uncharacterized protein n=1 Tax=Lepidopterella palustris CBS 459.81 TaxID=1314670 RepID=A0A8E2EMD1_9PEZI|nr:hypothetical protein K432DRAFT_376771 [Lepidopterella palustris CBS 459.81]